MCTSSTLKTENNLSILGRTFDFTELGEEMNIFVIPRNYKWFNKQENQVVNNKYAIVGVGIQYNNNIILSDGMNECGLMGAALYFEGYASYNNKKRPCYLNLTCYDVMTWILSQYNSVRDIINNFKNINLLCEKIELLGGEPPLHWIFSDRSANTIVIEPLKDGIKIYCNPVGVMANSPDFNWQLTNLQQYISVKVEDSDPVYWGDYELVPSDLSSGTFGLPGDFSSPSRFVRAAFLRNHIEPSYCEADGIKNTFKVLDYCSESKGIVLDEDELEYTIYTSVMCAQSGVYYYNTYNNMQINAVCLFNENLNSPCVKVYPLIDRQNINYQN